MIIIQKNYSWLHSKSVENLQRFNILEHLLTTQIYFKSYPKCQTNINFFF